MASILVNATHGNEDPERATLAFIVGNVAASADQEAVVLLTIDGVWLATQGYADSIHKEGFQPLKEVISSFVTNGGQIWVCGTCAKPRKRGNTTPWRASSPLMRFTCLVRSRVSVKSSRCRCRRSPKRSAAPRLGSPT